jgi:hypothetical protein
MLTKLVNFAANLHSLAIHWLVVLPSILAILFIIGALIDVRVVIYTAKGLAFLFPLWGPVFSAILWWHLWRIYIRSHFISNIETVVLEVLMPSSLEKTPASMEALFNSLHIVRAASVLFNQQWWHGMINPIWSFEIHSYEGQVRLYVHVHKDFQRYFESQLYAQYPEVTIREVRDYVSGLKFNRNIMEAWGVEYKLSKNDAYPIKTYVDFGLDDVHKEVAQRIDPLSSVFERFSNMGPGEQAMMQIITTRDMRKTNIKYTWIPFGPLQWKTEAKNEIDKIYKRTAIPYTNVETGEPKLGSSQLTPGEIEQIKALERTLSKHGFEVGIRTVYVTKKEAHRPRIRSSYFVHIWRQFSAGHLNTLGAGGDYWHQPLDFPWQDFRKIRWRYLSRRVLEAYRRRQMFFDPYVHNHVTMTTEELATIYHYPSDDCKAPGLVRQPSRYAAPPANLPT